MWSTIILAPLYNSLVVFINTTGGSFALGVILLTIATKLVLLPFSWKASKTQAIQKSLQPQIEKIKKDFPDQMEQTKRIMALYKEKNANPFSGCLPLLIQMPILFGIYQVFYRGVEQGAHLLYSGIVLHDTISYAMLGVNLLEKSVILAILAGLFQFAQVRLSPAFTNADPTAPGASMTRSMTLILPIMIGVISLSLPAAMALYFIINSLTSILQDLVFSRTMRHDA